VLHFCLARHLPDGLDGNTGGYHLGSFDLGVRGRGGCGGSAAASGTGLSVPGETGASSSDRLLSLSLVLVIICLD